MYRPSIAVVLALSILVSGCEADTGDEPPAADEPPAVDENDEPEATDIDYRWLPDGDAEKFAAIEDQLGGFSATMQQVGHRYVDLYWAGVDRNWDYADYQLDKIGDSIEAGIIRRPARAESARPFLDQDIPALAEAIDAEDGEAFDDAFDDFTQACNTCHGREEVPFVTVAPPEDRSTAVHFGN